MLGLTFSVFRKAYNQIVLDRAFGWKRIFWVLNKLVYICCKKFEDDSKFNVHYSLQVLVSTYEAVFLYIGSITQYVYSIHWLDKIDGLHRMMGVLLLCTWIWNCFPTDLFTLSWFGNKGTNYECHTIRVWNRNCFIMHFSFLIFLCAY